MIEDNSIFVFEGVARDIAMRLNQWNWRILDLGKQHLHLCNTLHYDCQGSYRPLLLIAIILIFDSWSSPCSSVLVTYTVTETDMFVKFKLQTEDPNFVNAMFHALWLLLPKPQLKICSIFRLTNMCRCASEARKRIGGTLLRRGEGRRVGDLTLGLNSLHWWINSSQFE